jgi:hypothetical protein
VYKGTCVVKYYATYNLERAKPCTARILQVLFSLLVSDKKCLHIPLLFRSSQEAKSAQVVHLSPQEGSGMGKGLALRDVSRWDTRVVTRRCGKVMDASEASSHADMMCTAR